MPMVFSHMLRRDGQKSYAQRYRHDEHKVNPETGCVERCENVLDFMYRRDAVSNGFAIRTDGKILKFRDVFVIFMLRVVSCTISAKCSLSVPAV